MPAPGPRPVRVGTERHERRSSPVPPACATAPGRGYGQGVAHEPDECAEVECGVDLGAQFCEHCGRDRDWYTSTRSTYRDCPTCRAACCADCWNVADGACLKCAPYRLVDAPAHERVVIASGPARGETSPAADPYADLRADPNVATARPRPTRTLGAVQIDSGIHAPGAARWEPDATPIAFAAPVHVGAGPGRRAGRIGVAASAAWIIVVAVAVAAFGASPNRAQAPAEAPPAGLPSPSAIPASD